MYVPCLPAIERNPWLIYRTCSLADFSLNSAETLSTLAIDDKSALMKLTLAEGLIAVVSCMMRSASGCDLGWEGGCGLV